MATISQTSTSISSGVLEQCSLAFKSSEDTRVNEEDKTLSLYEGSIAGMQQQITSLADKNRDLSTALITVESRHREPEVLRRAEISALEEKVKTSEEAVETMRKEMLEVMQKAHEMVQAALAEKETALKAVTELADERVAAAKQEVKTEMDAQRAELLRQVRIAADGQVNAILSAMQANTRYQNETRGSQSSFLMCFYKECAFSECYHRLKGFADWLEKLK